MTDASMTASKVAPKPSFTERYGAAMPYLLGVAVLPRSSARCASAPIRCRSATPAQIVAASGLALPLPDNPPWS